MVVGSDHDVPLNVATFPPSSTAAQNDADEHDTATDPPLVLMLVGADHEVPLNVTTPPVLSPAAQNDADGHDTAPRPPLLGSMLVGAPQTIAGVARAAR